VEPGVRQLSDGDVLAIDRSTYDKSAMMGRSEVLGLHNGIRLVADYPCSDVCPTYTTRIIHYALPPDRSCTAEGGAVHEELVPVSIAMVRQPFCMPRVIVDKKLD
jgi:hypothetical protein